MKLNICIAVAAATSAVADRVAYDGFKVFRITDVSDNIDETLAGFDKVQLTCGHTDHYDVAISPDDLDIFEELGLNTTLLSEDLGADIAEEGPVESFYGMSMSGFPRHIA